MRQVKSKLEYMIVCGCGVCYAYAIEDLRQHIKCPTCGSIHHLHGDHDIYMLQKINVVYPAPELLEDKQ